MAISSRHYPQTRKSVDTSSPYYLPTRESSDILFRLQFRRVNPPPCHLLPRLEIISWLHLKSRSSISFKHVSPIWLYHQQNPQSYEYSHSHDTFLIVLGSGVLVVPLAFSVFISGHVLHMVWFSYRGRGLDLGGHQFMVFLIVADCGSALVGTRIRDQNIKSFVVTVTIQQSFVKSKPC